MERLSKVFIIIWCALISFVYFFYVPMEPNFNRYPPHFVAFANMVDQGLISPDIFQIYQLSSRNINYPGFLTEGARYVVASNASWPAKTSFYLVWESIIGLSHVQLMNLPIAPVIAPPLIWILVRRLTPSSDIYKFLSFLFIIIYLSYQKTVMSNNNPAFTFPLMLAVLFFFYRTLQRNNMKEGILMITLGIFSLALWWHSAALRTSILILSIILMGGCLYLIQEYELLSIFSYNDLESSYYVSSPIAVLVVLLLLILTISTQTVGSPYMVEFIIDPPIKQLLNNLIGKSQGEVFKPVSYEFNYLELFIGKVYFYSRLTIFVLTAIVSLVFTLILTGQRWFSGLEMKNDAELYTFFGGILLAQAILVVLYARAGIGFWYMQSFAPVFVGVAFYSLKNRKLRIWGIIFLSTVIILSLSLPVIMVSTDGLGTIPSTTHNDIESSHAWIDDYSTDNPIITDFGQFGKYYYYESNEQQVENNFVRMSSQEYGMVIGDTQYTERFQDGYVAVDRRTMKHGKPVNAYGARSVLEPRLKEINSNQNNIKTYTDGNIAVYKVSE